MTRKEWFPSVRPMIGQPARRRRPRRSRLPSSAWPADCPAVSTPPSSSGKPCTRGADLVTEVPPDRWDVDEYYDPEPGVPGRTVSKWGAFLDDVAGFDSDFFGINEREATAMDPQHRLLLETSWEAMEHAGLDPEALTGLVDRRLHGLDALRLPTDQCRSDAMEGPYGFKGNTFSMASGRIAYALGVHGPAMTVDTACSSSLLAVHMGCRSLHEGESDLALAGGAFVHAGSAQVRRRHRPRAICPPRALSCVRRRGGRVRVRRSLPRWCCSSACPDAVRDGDRILAVVRGTAANQDGHTVNISTPSAAAQTEVYRAALGPPAWTPRTVGMVEAHGPGTPVGDPIEYASLSEVYGIEGPARWAR